MQTPASRPASRKQLKDFCLRQLGAPVLEINVDDDQVEDCIDLALQYFQDFHFDGVERWYLKHQISADDKTNQWIPITENILGVNKVWNVSSTNASVNMFDLRYQMRLHELYDFTSTSYVNYVMTMQHIRTLDMLFSGEIPVRFNRHTDKLYIDWDWENDIEVGEYIIVEGWIIIDPDAYTDVYNDRLLKNLATAYIKKQWGTNMKKYSGLSLPGGMSGIQVKGQEYYDEAVAEIKELEQKIRLEHQAPPEFYVGSFVSFLLNSSIGLSVMEAINRGAEIWNSLPLV